MKALVIRKKTFKTE